jgi:hypothetical protein
MSMMPVRYERDDSRRRVVVTSQGAFQMIDMLAVVERQRADDAWSYGTLFDLRGMIGQPALADLRELVGQSASGQAAERPRGPVAILATDPILYGVACTYAALGQATLTIRVFRESDEAAAWLTAHTSR